jgi:predicted TIM-barrel fold metal-dependent hydrolase
MRSDRTNARHDWRTGLPRRQFLAGLTAAGAGAFLSSCSGTEPAAEAPAAQAASPAGLMDVAAGRRVDVHNHFTSPGWFKELEAADLVPGARKGWNPARTVETLDKSGTKTALLSTGQAGGAFTPDRLKQRGVSEAQAAQEIRRLARESNEYGAKMVSDHPGRFVLMAALTMPDLDNSLKELEYALDTLKAGGVFLPTSHADKYIGDPSFTPLMEELNRRKVTVYTHPTDAACCINIIPGLPPNTIEYGTDTTRMIMSLIVNDVPNKFRGIQWIFSHAGGTMPFLVERIVGNRGQLTNVLQAQAEPDSRLDQLRRFYYDSAQTANPVAMAALKQVVGINQMVFGTDFPYSNMVDHVEGLANCGVFNEQELTQLYHTNAERMMPQLSAAAT